MIGYVAKDKDDTLYLYNRKPEYDKYSEMWFGGSNMIDLIDITGQFSEFDNMSYTDEPIKVEIKLERV